MTMCVWYYDTSQVDEMKSVMKGPPLLKLKIDLQICNAGAFLRNNLIFVRLLKWLSQWNFSEVLVNFHSCIYYKNMIH